MGKRCLDGCHDVCDFLPAHCDKLRDCSVYSYASFLEGVLKCAVLGAYIKILFQNTEARYPGISCFQYWAAMKGRQSVPLLIQFQYGRTISET